MDGADAAGAGAPALDRVERLAGEGQEGLAEGLVLRRVRVDEAGDVFGVRLPVDGELRLADQLADAGADHVDADDRAVVDAHDLDRAGRADDVALAVAGEVVVVGWRSCRRRTSRRPWPR